MEEGSFLCESWMICAVYPGLLMARSVDKLHKFVVAGHCLSVLHVCCGLSPCSCTEKAIPEHILEHRGLSKIFPTAQLCVLVLEQKGHFLHMCLVAGMDSFHGNIWLMSQVLSLTLWFLLQTATLYPGVVFGICFVLNCFIWGKHSSGAVGATLSLGPAGWERVTHRDSLGFPDLSKGVTGGLA